MTAKQVLVVLGLGIAALAPYLPIAWNDALPNAPHSDVMFAVQSSRGFIEGLAEGRLYPRWVEEANRGHGAPTFVYYSPGAYYAVALVSAATPDLLSAIRWTALALALASFATFLLAARRWSSNPLARAVAAALYVAMPYHVLDLYERMALAEFAAFVLYPVVFATADRLLDGPSRRAWIGLALSYGALVFTHLVSAFMIALVLGPFLLLRAALERKWLRCVPIGTAVAMGLACSAAYLLPVLVEREAVQIEHMDEMGRFDWRRSLLFRDEVAHGYRPASVKPAAEAASASQALMTLGAVGTLALLRRRSTADRNAGEAPGARSRVDAAWIVVALWTFALQTALTWPVWALVPGLATVQFPWRFAGFQALAGCVLVARALPVGARGAALPCLLGTLPALAVAVGIASGARFEYDRAVAERPKVRTRPAFAYVPRGVADRHALANEPARSTPRAQLVSPGELEVLSWQPHERRFATASEGENRLRIGTFAFEGWRARVDGEPAAIRPAGRWRSIEIDLPPGPHEVDVRFESTPIRWAGNTVSGLALFALAWAGWRGRARRRAAAALVLMAVATGCGPPEDPRARNLVVVTLDTVRRDHLSLYGYEFSTSPNLDAFAKHSVVFEDAIAQDTNTNPSHASMFTGLYPHVHGSRANGDILGPGPATLAELLRDRGFATAGFVSAAVLRGKASGLDRGFALYDDGFEARRRSGEITVSRALDWLAQRPRDERFLLFIHLYDAHGPYRPPAEHAARFQQPPHGQLPLVPRHMKSFDAQGRLFRYLSQFVDRYDATIHWVDSMFGRVAAAVDLEDTALIVLSDHGETLGERYHGLDHGGQVFDEQIRIPLIIRAPHITPGRVEGQVETVDLLPTALELLDLEPPDGLQLQGTSLISQLRGDTVRGDTAPAGDAFSSARAVSGRLGDRGYTLDPERRVQSIRAGRWKLIRYPGTGSDYLELYDLELDPGEGRNRADEHPAELAEARERLETWAAQRPASTSVRQTDPEIEQQLRALGYGD